MNMTDSDEFYQQGVWSIDGIYKPERSADIAIARLVHVSDIERSVPGVRYVGLDLRSMEDYRVGRCIVPNWKELRRDGIKNSHPILSAEAPVEFADDIEMALRSDIQQLIQGADEVVFRPEGSRAAQDLGNGVWARIYVHNVGQGDLIVLELPGNLFWLIDARLWGRPRRDAFDQWIKTFSQGKTFSKFIISHLHYDHIHSACHIIENFSPQEILVADSLNHASAAARRLLRKAGTRLRRMGQDQSIRMGALEITLFRSIQYSQNVASLDPNDHEIGACLRTPESKALLAGDIPAELCEAAVRNYLPSTARFSYYKVSHHGSRTGCSSSFLEALAPNHCVISCGKNNRYHHPHGLTLQKLPRPLVRTDEMILNDFDVYNMR